MEATSSAVAHSNTAAIGSCRQREVSRGHCGLEGTSINKAEALAPSLRLAGDKGKSKPLVASPVGIQKLGLRRSGADMRSSLEPQLIEAPRPAQYVGVRPRRRFDLSQ